MSPLLHTKEGSYQAANAWWEKKQADIDAAEQRPSLPMEDLAAAVLHQKGQLSQENARQLLAIETLLRASREVGMEVVVQVGADGDTVIYPASGMNWRTLTPAEMLAESVEKVGTRVVQQVVAGKKLPDAMAKQLPPARVVELEHHAAAMRGEIKPPREKLLRTWS